MSDENPGKGTATETTFSRRDIAALPVGAAVLAALAPQAQAKSLPDQPTVEERARIEDLFTSYVWAYDCSDVNVFLSLFVDQDPMVVGFGKAHRGKPALAQWFAYLLAIREKDNNLWMHQASHHKYVRNGKNWLVFSYAPHFAYDATTLKSPVVRSLGYFVSEVEPAGAGFRFRRFSINHWDKTAAPWSKPMPWAEFERTA